MEVEMRFVCKDRKADSFGTIRRETLLLNLTSRIAPSSEVFVALDEYLSEWSRYLLSESSSPKNK